MIIPKSALATASTKTKRRVRYEYELESAALDCIFAANSTPEFRTLLDNTVYADPRLDQLPVFRQACLDAYIRGALDYAARSVGQAVTQPPDCVQPRMSRRPSARASMPPIPKAAKVPMEAAGTVVSMPPPAAAAPMAAAARSPSMPGGHSIPGQGFWNLIRGRGRSGR